MRENRKAVEIIRIWEIFQMLHAKPIIQVGSDTTKSFSPFVHCNCQKKSSIKRHKSGFNAEGIEI